MRFDSNQAWRDAAAAVGANREVLFALAGVFFLLPSFIFGVLAPRVEPTPGATPREVWAQMGPIYGELMPYILLMAAVQLIGTLAILTLFTDRTRPTVGEAIRRGAIGALPCFGAQMLLGAGGGMVLLAIVAIGGLSGSPAIAIAGLFVAIGVVIWLWTRLSLIPPVVAVERMLNPFAILARSWRLTSGNAARLLLFYVLLVIAFVLVGALVMAALGLVLTVALPAEPARIVGALGQAAFTAVFVLYFIAVLASAHRQLAGGSPEAAARTFE